MGTPGFWNDQKTAQATAKKLSDLKNQVDFWEKLENEATELQELGKMAAEEKDSRLEKDLEKKLGDLKERYEQVRIRTFLNRTYDDHGAIISIHAGAGGLDAQDWAEILERMYLRFCEKRGYKVNFFDQNRNPEGGIKSATFEVRGEYAYGYLRSEAGVHRLIRLSPFNPAHTRETSFALVEVLPVLEQQEELDLDPKELKIETKTASGHGGKYDIFGCSNNTFTDGAHSVDPERTKPDAKQGAGPENFEIQTQKTRRRKADSGKIETARGIQKRRVGEPDPQLHAPSL